MVTPCIKQCWNLLLPTDEHNVKKRRVIKTSLFIHLHHRHNILIDEQQANDNNPLFELAFIPRDLSNLLDIVYLHTVHDTHALQGKSDFIPLLSNLLFISLNFYSHITYISFITVTVTICSHSTDDALHIFSLLTKRVIFSQALTLAPWRWFLCKPKHVGAFLSILECFSNSAFFNVVCISW